MVSMTYHHQIIARKRFPEIMDRREALMQLWLTIYDLHDAAEMIELIDRYGLKDGALPHDYCPDDAERFYGAVVRSQDEIAHMDALRALGVEAEPDLSLGRRVL